MIRQINLIILGSFGLMMQFCDNELPSEPPHWVEIPDDGIHSPILYPQNITTDYNGLFVWNKSSTCELFYHTNIDEIWSGSISHSCPPGAVWDGLGVNGSGGKILKTGNYLLNGTRFGIYYSADNGATWQKSSGSTNLYISCLDYNPLTGLVVAKIDSLVSAISYSPLYGAILQYKSVSSSLITSSNGGKDWTRPNVNSLPAYPCYQLCSGNDKLLSLQSNQGRLEIYKSLQNVSWEKFMTGIPSDIQVLKLRSDNKGILYALCKTPLSDNIFTLDIYKLDDNTESWGILNISDPVQLSEYDDSDFFVMKNDIVLFARIDRLTRIFRAQSKN